MPFVVSPERSSREQSQIEQLDNQTGGYRRKLVVSEWMALDGVFDADTMDQGVTRLLPRGRQANGNHRLVFLPRKKELSSHSEGIFRFP